MGLLTPLETSLDNESRIFARLSTQISLVIKGEHSFKETQKKVLQWGLDKRRNIRNIPQKAWDGEAFDIDQENSEQAAAIKIREPNIWAFRLKETLRGDNRIWTTEICIAEKSPGETLLGLRLICSQRGLKEQVPRSIPNFIRSIAFTKECYLDGRRTSAEPWLIHTENDVYQFIEFLENPKRKHPIVLFSTLEDSDDPSTTAIKVKDYIRKTVGFVHTAIISSSASYVLTRELGKEFSVYRRAIRTYNPGFNTDEDAPTDHPVATAVRIQNWPEENDTNFLGFLVQQTLRPTQTRTELEESQPSFQRLKQVAAQQEYGKASQNKRHASEHMQSPDAEIKAAKAEALARKTEAEESLQTAIEYEAQRNQMHSELGQLKARYRALQSRLDSLQNKSPTASTPIPTTLSEIDDWADLHLSGQVVLHHKALKAVRASDFSDIPLIYKTLLLLRDYYVPMRKEGGPEKKSAFDSKLAELYLENSPCFMQAGKAKQFDGDYFVTFQGQKRELNFHLKGNSSRNGRFGFRLYYFWDDETSQVVVGYLPGHLSNDIT